MALYVAPHVPPHYTWHHPASITPPPYAPWRAPACPATRHDAAKGMRLFKHGRHAPREAPDVNGNAFERRPCLGKIRPLHDRFSPPMYGTPDGNTHRAQDGWRFPKSFYLLSNSFQVPANLPHSLQLRCLTGSNLGKTIGIQPIYRVSTRHALHYHAAILRTLNLLSESTLSPERL